MKNIIKFFLIITITLFSFQWVFAEGEATNSDTKTITVTEKLPWMECGDKLPNDTYICDVKPGFQSVSLLLTGMIKYFTYIAGIAWVLFIVVNGIMYSMGGIDDGMKDEAKKRVQKTIIWLVLLFLSGFILNLVAPWIYK